MKLKTKHRCPNCNKLLDGVTCMEEDVSPKKDDTAVCFYCGTLLIFDKDLNPVGLPPKKLNEIEILKPDYHKKLMAFQSYIFAKLE